MEQRIIYIGLDVHKETIAVAVAEAGKREEAREYGKIANTSAALKTLTAKLSRAGTELRFCYEAGPCGYGIQRQLSTAGHGCVPDGLIGSERASWLRELVDWWQRDRSHLEHRIPYLHGARLRRYGGTFDQIGPNSATVDDKGQHPSHCHPRRPNTRFQGGRDWGRVRVFLPCGVSAARRGCWSYRHRRDCILPRPGDETLVADQCRRAPHAAAGDLRRSRLLSRSHNHRRGRRPYHLPVTDSGLDAAHRSLA